MPIIRVPSAWSVLTGGQVRVPVNGQTLQECLTHFCTEYPQTRARLFSESGQLVSFMNIYLEDVDVRELGGLDGTVPSDAVLTIVPSLAGG